MRCDSPHTPLHLPARARRFPCATAMAVEEEGEGETTGNWKGKGKRKRRGGDEILVAAHTAGMGGVAMGGQVLRQRRCASNALIDRETDDEDYQVGMENRPPSFFLSLGICSFLCIFPAYIYLTISI